MAFIIQLTTKCRQISKLQLLSRYRNTFFCKSPAITSFENHINFSFPCAKHCRYFSEDHKRSDGKTSQSSSLNNADKKISQKVRLKQAVRDYGATIIVFHVAVALTSLGICYVAISNGVDAVRVLTFLGFSESIISSKVAVGGSTFVMAYAVHKVFAPVRIGITLTLAPLIVRYLRKTNWIKPPRPK